MFVELKALRGIWVGWVGDVGDWFDRVPTEMVWTQAGSLASAS